MPYPVRSRPSSAEFAILYAVELAQRVEIAFTIFEPSPFALANRGNAVDGLHFWRIVLFEHGPALAGGCLDVDPAAVECATPGRRTESWGLPDLCGERRRVGISSGDVRRLHAAGLASLGRDRQFHRGAYGAASDALAALEDTDHANPAGRTAGNPFSDPSTGEQRIEYWIWTGSRLVLASPEAAERLRQQEALEQEELRLLRGYQRANILRHRQT